MDKHRQMPVKVVHIPVSLLKGDFRIDVRDTRRKDRQLDLWHSEIVATFGDQNHPFFLSSNAVKSSHPTSLPLHLHPRGIRSSGAKLSCPFGFGAGPSAQIASLNTCS